ncbi:VCBS repeat-containing protein [Lewinella sp. 4G2]|uniref:VCBS repeat-containing protein n=1 Tax=Lewinella sp. 4G2 TaxID=1803372 RepID=UPI0007B4EFB4|nr:VCBS repeat-containing protein [Lewinella sp. 4G2]OAV45324.1 hypothetical protein A3850_012840 [Lewinella sp. 4G2]
MNRSLLALFSFSLLCFSCVDNGTVDNPTSENSYVPFVESATGVDFINTVTEGEEFNVLSYRLFYNGAGVAIGDLNGDGQNDLYFAANQGENQLYLNQGELNFQLAEGAAAGAGKWATGVTTVDVNADGRMDLYVCVSGKDDGEARQNLLYINEGNNEQGVPQFTEAAAAYGLADQGYSTQAAWFDYDRDGDLDMYLLNNSYLNPEKINARGENRNERDDEGGDKLFRNDAGPNGHPVFTDVSEEANILGSRIGFGLGSSLTDVNSDGWTDIYISNDFWERDYLYINQQDGTFSEELVDRTGHVSISSMGSDAADLDNDGDTEIFSTDMLPGDNQRIKASTVFDSYDAETIKFGFDYHHQILQNCLQVNDGNGNFRETGHYSGVASTDWSWGALLFDMNNDGLKDIFVANGIYRDIMDLDFADFLQDKEQLGDLVREKGRYDWRDVVELMPHNDQPNYAFINQGELRFDNAAAALGLANPSFSNGSAYGDLDGDGDLDLVINNANQKAGVFINQSSQSGQSWLGLILDGPEGNAEGIGAKVTLYQDGREQTLEQFTSRGYLGSCGPELIFGLGDIAEVERVEIRWPDGKMQTINQPTSNTYLTVNHSDAEEVPAPDEAFAAEPMLDAAYDLLDIPAVHVENDFNDFAVEPLLLRKLSEVGPEIVKGDVNGDGLEDFVALGSWDDPDKLYLQQPDGTFAFKPNGSFDATKQRESTAGAFFDSDGDGDQDLLIASGGNEFERGYLKYAVRFYENVNGVLVVNNVLAPPYAGGEISCIKAEDIDFDGDIDLYMGGRGVPGNYGLTAQSFLFINEKGSWLKMTPRDIATAGLVTDAVWTDLNTDGRPDLVMVGDWMPITVAFMLHDGEISGIFEIPNSAGWWNTVEAADLDGDGKEDLVLGNWGLNSKLKASTERPLSLHVKDFDGNQKSDILVEWFPPHDDKAYPFATKKDIQAQLPHLKRKTLKYNDYAQATYESLFTDEERSDAESRTATELRSCVVWNKGKGNVRIEPLPWQAQLTCQYAVAIGDVNGDDRPDLWLGGNQFGVTPQVGRPDAGRGTLLLNKGNREWEYVDNQKAGVNIPGQVRDATFIDLANGGKGLLVGCNDDTLRTYRLSEYATK